MEEKKMSDLISFLRGRGVVEKYLDSLKEEKIDPHTLLAMTDEQLKVYIPTFGDMHAARNYCNQNIMEEQKNERRSTLLKKLRSKMKMKTTKTCTESDSDSDNAKGAFKRKQKLLGNFNAVKNKRKIELGWFNYDHAQGEFHQVKSRNGGGTREVSAPKSWLPVDIINHGRKIFFLNGRSKKGNVDDFEFQLRNFMGDPVEEDCTVKDLYTATDARILRFYIYSKKKICAEQASISDDDLPDPKIDNSPSTSSDNCLPSSSASVEQSKPSTVAPSTLPVVPKQMIIQEDEETTLLCGSNDSDFILMQSLNPIANIIDFETASLSNLLVVNNNNDTLPVEERPLDMLPAAFETISENGLSTRVIRIHQSNIFSEMLEIFKSDETDLDIDACKVVRVLPSGKDEMGEGTGLIRDIFTQFWDIFYRKCCDGNEVKVPVLRHDMQEVQWESVGRIIVNGYKTVNYFPIHISKAVLEDALYGVVKTDLMETFMGFIPNTERAILGAALKNFESVDLEELMDTLQSHDCRKNPSGETLKSIIEEIAHKEIIQQPKFVTDCWKGVFQRNLHLDHDTLSTLYEEKQPTVSKVLKILKFPDFLNIKEQIAANYLKKFIKELEYKDLKSFMRFCTGSNLLCDVIHVEFTQLSGYQRRPTAHTCSFILRIPSTYESLAELREEFLNLFQGNIWDMDYV